MCSRQMVKMLNCRMCCRELQQLTTLTLKKKDFIKQILIRIIQTFTKNHGSQTTDCAMRAIVRRISHNLPKVGNILTNELEVEEVKHKQLTK